MTRLNFVQRSIVFLILGQASIEAFAQPGDPYQEGHIWKRRVAWDRNLGDWQFGSSAGNPLLDQRGEGVWYFEWTLGDRADSRYPWFEQPSSLMFWDLWDPERAKTKQLWVRADNTEPVVSKWGMSHSRSEFWGSSDFQSLVRWENPTGQEIYISISGVADVLWGGRGSSEPNGSSTEVDFLIGKRDTGGSVIPIELRRLSNPSPEVTVEPYPEIRMNIDIPLIRVGAGESIAFSVRALVFPTERDSWISLKDNLNIRLESQSTQGQPGVFLGGEPNWTARQYPFLQIWQEYYDGPFTVRAVGPSSATSNYEIAVLSNEEVAVEASDSFEPNDSIEQAGQRAVLWRGVVTNSTDEISVSRRPESTTVIGWDFEGHNSDEVELGETRARYVPDAIMLLPEELATSANAGSLGPLRLVLSKDQSPDALRFAWGNSLARNTPSHIELLADTTLSAIPSKFESSDMISVSGNHVSVDATMYGGRDEVDLLSTGSGFRAIYLQYGVGDQYRPDLVDLGAGAYGGNAVKVPTPSSLGEPSLSPATDRGFFIWRDESGKWIARCSPGGRYTRCAGQITSSHAISSLQGYKLESSDTLELTPTGGVIFDIAVQNGFEDGFEFSSSSSAVLRLEMTGGEDPVAGQMRIGQRQWPVLNNPVIVTQ